MAPINPVFSYTSSNTQGEMLQLGDYFAHFPEESFSPSTDAANDDEIIGVLELSADGNSIELEIDEDMDDDTLQQMLDNISELLGTEWQFDEHAENPEISASEEVEGEDDVERQMRQELNEIYLAFEEEDDDMPELISGSDDEDDSDYDEEEDDALNEAQYISLSDFSDDEEEEYCEGDYNDEEIRNEPHAPLHDEEDEETESEDDDYFRNMPVYGSERRYFLNNPTTRRNTILT